MAHDDGQSRSDIQGGICFFVVRTGPQAAWAVAFT
jgi:hypothetical protein